jgi:hypothetical protein
LVRCHGFVEKCVPSSQRAPSALFKIANHAHQRRRRGAAGQPPILEPVSGQVGLCFPGKVILGGRDRTAVTSVRHSARNPETRSTRWKAPIRGYLAPSPEISAMRRLIGGAIRTRTMDPLGWVCEICAKKSRLPDRPTLSRPGAAGEAETERQCAHERAHRSGLCDFLPPSIAGPCRV